MGFNTIEFDISEGVATLTLNRPKALNSFTMEMHGEVRDTEIAVFHGRSSKRGQPSITHADIKGLTKDHD